MNAEKDPLARIQKLVAEVRKHNKHYYDQDEPVISDSKYDALYQQLLDLEKKHPKLRQSDSPTQVIGGRADGMFTPVKHRVPMLSLDKAHDLASVELYFKRLLKVGGQACVALPKLDGMAVSLIYKKRKLVRGVTRGDGTTGEDITANIRRVKGVLQKLPAKLPAELEIRGEMMMSRKAFNQLNAYQRKRKEKTFVSPRNAAAGCLRSLQPDRQRLNSLEFFAYWAMLPEGELAPTAMQLFNLLEPYVNTSQPRYLIDITSCAQEDGTERIFAPLRSAYEAHQQSSNFETDGIVLRMDDIALAKQMKSSAKAPKSMLAYKFASVAVPATLLGVEFQVGRTGAITPVGKLEPVRVGDVTVSSVTLHTCGLLKKLKLSVNDQITITRSGDVIPKLLVPAPSEKKLAEYLEKKKRKTKFAGKKAEIRDRIKLSQIEIREIGIALYAKELKKQRKKKTKVFGLRQKCPECRTKLEWQKNKQGTSENLICPKPTCAAKNVQQLKHFVSRVGLDIRGFGVTRLKELVTHKLALQPVDLFGLTQDQLKKIERMGEKSANNLLEELAKARNTTLGRVLNAIGLPRLGTVGAAELAQAFGGVANLASTSPAAICFVKEVEFDVAVAVKNSLNAEGGKSLNDLKTKGVTWDELGPAGGQFPISALLAHVNYLSSNQQEELEPAVTHDLFSQDDGWRSLSTEFLVRLQSSAAAPVTYPELQSMNVDNCLDICSGAKQLAQNGYEQIQELLQSQKFIELEQELRKKLAIEWQQPNVTAAKSLQNMTVVVSGRLPGFTRPEAQQLVVANGGKAGSEVSGRTDLLVLGSKPGAVKISTATKFGVKQISGEEFLAMLEQDKT